MAADVFISYPHQDQKAADAACAALEAAGVRCWIAHRDIPPGSEWAAAIIHAIDHCRAMVLILSSRANKSKQVGREVLRAYERDVHVIPVRVEDVRPTEALAYYLGPVHWFDVLVPPIEPHLERLAKSLADLLQVSSGRKKNDTIVASAQTAHEMLNSTLSLSNLQTTLRALSDHIVQTPTLLASSLSELTGAKVFVKYENHQVTNSFKERGVRAKLCSLSEAERVRGVIAMSAGNHAQAVAYQAATLKIPATLVMPAVVPFARVTAVEARGAQVVLAGETLAEAQLHAEAIAKERGLTWIHPYDDPYVIAGHGTISLEMLEQVSDLDVLIIPIGGGALIAGMAIAAKALRPVIEIVGVESALYPSMWNALHTRNEQRPVGGATLADGIAVKNVGVLTLPIVRNLVSDIVLVQEEEIERAVGVFLRLQKVLAEGAGAAGLAAMLTEPKRFIGKRVGLVLSGSNIEPRTSASITVRELEREDRIVSFRLTVPDRPGLLGLIASRIGSLGANILAVKHRRLFLDVPAKGARLDVVIETNDAAHAKEVFAALRDDGFAPLRLAADGGIASSMLVEA